MKYFILLLLFAGFAAATCDVTYLNENLDSCYNMEESSSPYVDDMGTINLISGSSPDRTGGFDNYGQYFTSDYLEGSDMYEEQDLTWSVMMNRNDTGQHQVIASKWTTTGKQYSFRIESGTNFGGFWIYNGANSDSLNTGAVPSDEWFMMTATYEHSSSYVTLGINGAVNASKTMSYQMGTGSNEFEIGNYYNGYITSNSDFKLDLVRIFTASLNASCQEMLYNRTVAGNTCYFVDSFLTNISNIRCTSPTPDDYSEPYSTGDITPTFMFDTNSYAWCRISDQDLDYDNMGVNCTGGEGTQNHTCTLHDDDALPGAGTHYVYITCTDGVYPQNSSNNLDLEMDILAANETEARAAIETGISNAVPSASIFTDQQIYVIYDDESQDLVSFDKVAVYNSKYWAFNYVYGDVNDSTDNVGTTLYSWINWTLTMDQITSQVQALIESTMI